MIDLIAVYRALKMIKQESWRFYFTAKIFTAEYVCINMLWSALWNAQMLINFSVYYILLVYIANKWSAEFSVLKVKRLRSSANNRHLFQTT